MLRSRGDTLRIEEHPLCPFYYFIILSSNVSYPKTGPRKSKECDLLVVKDHQGVVHRKPRSKGVKDAKKIVVRKARLHGRDSEVSNGPQGKG